MNTIQFPNPPSDDHTTDHPDDEQFAQALSEMATSIQPRDTFAASLEAQLHAAHPANQSIQNKTTVKGDPTMKLTYKNRPMMVAAASIIALLMVALFIMPISSLAQDFIDDFFNRTSDTETFDEPSILSPIEATPSDGVISRQPQTLANLEAEAPFDVKIPAYVPEGFTFTDASFDPVAKHTFQIYYTGRNATYDSFSIVQMRLEDALQLDVGESATVLLVQINGHNGEYVEGGWRAIVHEDDNTHIIEGREWDGDFPYRQMLWSDGEFVYWMQSVVGQPSDLPLEEWINIAENLE